MRTAYFETYRDRAGKYRWRLVAANNRTIADSGEGYARRRNAQRAVQDMVAKIKCYNLTGWEDAT